MNEKFSVYDSWGNFIGYAVPAKGCPGGIIILLLFIPLISIFYLVNIFRIGYRLLQKGAIPKAILWFGMWLYPLIAFGTSGGLGYAFLGPPDAPIPTDLQAVAVGHALLSFVLISFIPIVFLIQLLMVFKYSNLKF
jgi:hypothetical protein